MRTLAFLLSQVRRNGSKMMWILVRISACTWAAGISFSSSTSAAVQVLCRSASFLLEFFLIRRRDSARNPYARKQHPGVRISATVAMHTCWCVDWLGAAVAQ